MPTINLVTALEENDHGARRSRSDGRATRAGAGTGEPGPARPAPGLAAGPHPGRPGGAPTAGTRARRTTPRIPREGAHLPPCVATAAADLNHRPPGFPPSWRQPSRAVI